MDDRRDFPQSAPPPGGEAQLRGEAVLRFLENNPDFLIAHGLTSPTREARVINLGQRLIARAGHVIRQYRSARGQMESILAANGENTRRVHETAYLLMAAGSRGEIEAIIRDHFPAILGVPTAMLVEMDDGDTLAALMGDGEIVLGACDTPAMRAIWEGVQSPAPPSAAFAVLPAIIPDTGPRRVLALAGEGADSFRADDGSDLLRFTATMIAIALARVG